MFVWDYPSFLQKKDAPKIPFGYRQQFSMWELSLAGWCNQYLDDRVSALSPNGAARNGAGTWEMAPKGSVGFGSGLGSPKPASPELCYSDLLFMTFICPKSLSLYQSSVWVVQEQVLGHYPWRSSQGFKQTASFFQWTKSPFIFAVKCYAGSSSWPWSSGLEVPAGIETHSLPWRVFASTVFSGFTAIAPECRDQCFLCLYPSY